MSFTAERHSGRLRSVDAYRGFVMLAMASGGIAIFGDLPGSDSSMTSLLLQVFSQQFDHALWRGCTFWDLIQPSFMFLVGVAMPFSFAHRRARGDRWITMFSHVLLRSFVLIVLAVFLASNGSRHTVYSFVNVLGQIGLGYTIVFLLVGRPPAVQLIVAIAILVGYWLFFALYPLPGPGFPLGAYGAGETQLAMSGFFAHCPLE
jgi:predicted acyltransferase